MPGFPRRVCAKDRGAWHRGRTLRALSAIAFVLTAGPAVAAASTPDWDQAENITDAAQRLARMQRAQGAQKAFEFIDACYRTHSLSSKYTKAFEACIAQDYMETQVLALIYSRIKPEALKAMRAPTPQVLAQTMGKRIRTAFAKYDVPKERIEAFKELVDEHGLPVFFRALFPNAKMPVPKGGQLPDGDPPTDPDKKQ
jgi:hypothetical protein